MRFTPSGVSGAGKTTLTLREPRSSTSPQVLAIGTARRPSRAGWLKKSGLLDPEARTCCLEPPWSPSPATQLATSSNPDRSRQQPRLLPPAILVATSSNPECCLHQPGVLPQAIRIAVSGNSGRCLQQPGVLDSGSRTCWSFPIWPARSRCPGCWLSRSGVHDLAVATCWVSSSAMHVLATRSASLGKCLDEAQHSRRPVQQRRLPKTQDQPAMR